MDDLAQEGFLAAFRSLPTFRRGDDFGAGLRGIARNKLFAHWRQTARRNRAMDPFRAEVAQVVESDLERAVSADRSETIETLLRCIQQLPKKLRRVVSVRGRPGDDPAGPGARSSLCG